jgi:adenine deaminase
VKISNRKTLIRTAMGLDQFDLIIENVNIVEVYTGKIEPGSLGIKDGRIVTLNAKGGDTIETYDGNGFFALPGFIDTHVHIDSTLLTPENLSELIVPCGTTVMLADPMEIANVAGLPGVKVLLESMHILPYHIFIEVPSRVPTAPGFETTGCELGLEEVKEILQWPECVSLGEMDPSKILGLKDEYLQKTEYAHTLGKICNGHAAGLTKQELVAYACGGPTDDHECINFEDAFIRLRNGMSVLVREGSTEHNLDPIIKGVVAEKLETRNLMFCTDDKHPDDIIINGHINYMVNRSIELGIPPIQAIQMASLNAAQHFHIDHLVGSLTPGRWADIILSEKLDVIVPKDVFVKGELVAHDGSLVVSSPNRKYPDWICKTVNIINGNKPNDFKLIQDGKSVQVHVIKLYTDQIINEIEEATLSIENSDVTSDPKQDVLKIAVVERYGKNGGIGIAFVKGFGLQQGALASSVAHDHHNIIVVGTNNEDMAVCVRAIEDMQGGLVVASEGKVLGQLPLPIGGLLSERPAPEIISELKNITDISKQLGGKLPAPFMTLSFISLPTIPEFGLTDMGLFDVRNHKLISPFK